MVRKIKYIALLAVFSTAQVTYAFQADLDDEATPLDQVVPVAEDDSDDAGNVTGVDEVQELVDEERILIEFARYRRLLTEGSLDEADMAAKRIVEMALRIYGPQSRETASALNNLGIVQHGNEQYDAAIQNFSASIEILENVENRLDGSLINPLKGLGAAQLGIERPDQALKTFTRAAHITHVNEGPHNLDQVEILESLAETQLRLGETKEARQMLDRIHGLNVRHFEKNPMGLLPSLMNRATWQHRAGYFAEERLSYRRAIRIVEVSAGKNDPLLIEPLRRLGESFYYVDTNKDSSQMYGTVAGVETYFKRAAKIADRAEDLDWRELTTTKLALADYYLYVEEFGRSNRVYSEVWEFLSTDDERLAARGELLEQPVVLRANDLPPYAGGIPARNLGPGELVVGTIVVNYTVTSRGRVRELRTEAFPPEFTDMQRTVHREVRRRLFRPKFVEAAAVQVDGLVFEHNFSFLQADLDSMRAKKSGTTTANENDDGGD